MDIKDLTLLVKMITETDYHRILNLIIRKRKLYPTWSQDGYINVAAPAAQMYSAPSRCCPAATAVTHPPRGGERLIHR